MGILPVRSFNTKFSNVHSEILRHEGVICAIKDYQKKLCIEVKENFVIEDAPLWKCVLKCSVKDVYVCLVKNNDSLRCLGKLSKELSTETVTFEDVFKTTNDTCLR